MAYLFGDSTPADLGVDYIEFLRDALDFSVQILAADERMRQSAARGVDVVKLSDGEVARLEALEGLAAVIELEVPPGHLLASIARVDKVVERLEVHAPESGGWLRKEVKLRPQRLDKEFITALVSGAQETLIHLRGAADGTG